MPAREVHRESWTDSGDVEDMRESFAGANPLITRLMAKVDSAEKTLKAGFFAPLRSSRPLCQVLVGSSRRMNQTNICTCESLRAMFRAWRA